MPRVLIALCVASIGAVLAACAQRIETVVETAGARVQQQVIFDTPMPEVPASMRLFALDAQAPGPGLAAALQGGRLRSFAAQSGPLPPTVFNPTLVTPRPSAASDNELAPHLGALVAEPRPSDLTAAQELRRMDTTAALRTMNRFATLDEGFIKDVSRSEVMAPRMLRHMRARRDPETGVVTYSTMRELAAFVPVQRLVDGIAIDGPGSRFTGVFADNSGDELAGIVLDRKRAQLLESVSSARSSAEIRADILRQISALKARGFVHVQNVKLAYYDGNKTLLQPVYRFIVEVSRDAATRGGSQHLVGYVRYANTDESVPELGDAGATTLSRGQEPDLASPQRLQTSHFPSVGRYVARASNVGWSADAQGFWDATLTVTDGVRFADAQFYDATPAHFLGPTKDQFVNAVDIALVEAHGFKWGFATEGNSRSFVDLRSQFANAAYGADAAGRLKHWILHSCDVVASPQEDPDWSKPWWGIFHGLQTVLGYHTPMFIDDGAGAAFGRLLAHGQPVLGSWFAAVSSLNVYTNDPLTRSRCDGVETVGLPAAISACDTGDAIASTEGRGSPNCLDVWWIADETLR